MSFSRKPVDSLFVSLDALRLATIGWNRCGRFLFGLLFLGALQNNAIASANAVSPCGAEISGAFSTTVFFDSVPTLIINLVTSGQYKVEPQGFPYAGCTDVPTYWIQVYDLTQHRLCASVIIEYNPYLAPRIAANGGYYMTVLPTCDTAFSCTRINYGDLISIVETAETITDGGTITQAGDLDFDRFLIHLQRAF